MSDTTTISPATYHQILSAIRQGGHEVEMAVTTAPDGTHTRTIVIRPSAPVAPKPEPQPQPEPCYYCPECEPRPSVATCTPGRVEYTGVVARRCTQHMKCSGCGKRLEAHERYQCQDCNALGQIAW